MSLNFKIIFLFFALASFFNMNAQTCKLELKVIDDKTSKALSLIKISYRPLGKQIYNLIYTDSKGFCVIDCKMKRNYEIIVEDKAYHWYSKVIEIDTERIQLTCRLVSAEDDEPPLFYTDLALEDYLHVGYGLNSIVPFNSNAFKMGFQLEEIISYKRKIGKRSQLGYEIPLRYSRMYLQNNFQKSGITFRQGNYSYVSTGISLYQRTFVTIRKENGMPGLFIDFGLGYEMPIAFRLYYKDEYGYRSVVKGIHNFNDFNAFMRLGYSRMALKCMYRASQPIVSTYFGLPNWRIGVEYNLPQ